MAGDEEQKSQADEILKENMSELEGSITGEIDDRAKRLEEGMRNLQFELRDKNEVILNQKEEIENLKVEVRARDMNITRMNKTMGELHEQIRDLKLYEVELKQILSKKGVLEEQNNDMKL